MRTQPWCLVLGINLALAFVSIPVFAVEPACPKIRGIAHQGYFISDNAKTEHFYGDILGFSQMSPRRNKDGVIDMLKFRVGALHSLELFLEKNPAGPRHYHFAFFSEDGEAMRQCLAAYGAKVPGEPIQDMGNYFSRDGDGVITEVVDFRKYAADFASQPKRGGISQQIDHIGFVVPNLDNALRFYAGFLGFKEIGRASVGDHGAWSVKLQLPDSREYIELIETKQPLSPDALNSFNSLALVVDSPQAVAEQLRAKGVRVENKSADQVDIFDPDGTRIELLKR